MTARNHSAICCGLSSAPMRKKCCMDRELQGTTLAMPWVTCGMEVGLQVVEVWWGGGAIVQGQQSWHHTVPRHRVQYASAGVIHSGSIQATHVCASCECDHFRVTTKLQVQIYLDAALFVAAEDAAVSRTSMQNRVGSLPSTDMPRQSKYFDSRNHA